jgi:N-acetylglutamate synthase-like GNAT family acetyltransferase
MYRITSPTTAEEFERYYELRWRMLRKPWDQPRGSEKDDKENSSVHIMICDENNNIIGIGRAHFNSPDEAQVRFMAVEEGYQKKGIGSIILNELEKKIIEYKAKYIVLNARDTAIPFYKKHLYYEVKQTISLFGTIPHHIMRKDLV